MLMIMAESCVCMDSGFTRHQIWIIFHFNWGITSSQASKEEPKTISGMGWAGIRQYIPLF